MEHAAGLQQPHDERPQGIGGYPVGGADAGQAVGEISIARAADRRAVQGGAVAAPAGEHLIVDRIVDQADDHLVVAIICDGDCPAGESLDETGGAVDRVDHPGALTDRRRGAAGFLADEHIVGPSHRQAPADQLLSFDIGVAGDVVDALLRQGERGDFAVIGERQGAGLADQLFGECEPCGVGVLYHTLHSRRVGAAIVGTNHCRRISLNLDA